MPRPTAASRKPAFLDLVAGAAAIVFTLPKDDMLNGASRCIKRMGLLRGDDVEMRYRRLDMRCTRTKTDAIDHDLARHRRVGGGSLAGGAPAAVAGYGKRILYFPLLHVVAACRTRVRPSHDGEFSMDITGVGAASGMHAVSGASSSGPPQQKMSSLFDSIDTSGSGSITQAQFDQAFQTKNPPAVFQKQGADAIFASARSQRHRQRLEAGFRLRHVEADGLAARRQCRAVGDRSPSASLAASLQALNQIDPSSRVAETPRPAPWSTSRPDPKRLGAAASSLIVDHDMADAEPFEPGRPLPAPAASPRSQDFPPPGSDRMITVTDDSPCAGHPVRGSRM